MPQFDQLLVPFIVLLVVLIAILSARLLFRLMVAFVAILVIWFGLYLVGIAPSPVSFFKKQDTLQETILDEQKQETNKTF